jgi:hypothetical protein
MDISRSSTDEVGPSRPFSRPNATIDFLFVNESSDLPAYRVGNRQDIRSHVRRHAARHFKQKHKTGQKKVAKERKWALLASRDPDHFASELALHHEDCPSALSEQTWLASSDPDPLAYSKGLPFEDDPTIPEVIGVNPPSAMKAFPELRDTDDLVLNEPNIEGDLGYYCKSCGAQLHSPIGLTTRVHANGGRMIKTGQVWKLSPVEILGAGRVDPFLSYPVEKPDRYLHELIDLGKSPDLDVSQSPLL